MNAIHSYLTRTAGLLAGALLVVSGGYAATATKAATGEADALPTFTDNYIKVSAQGASLSGSKEAFQSRTQQPKSGAFGVEELNVTRELSKGTTLMVDGKANAGAEDYLLSFRVTKEEVGSFEAGYQRVRTFYDGLGGFFPINNSWLPLYKRANFVDRGKFFVNGTIAMPKAPVYTFRYTNELRNGRKDSTILGDSDLTGVPYYINGVANPISPNRKIVPAYLQLAERHEEWETAVRHTVDKTTMRFAVSGDKINNDDTRSVDRYPGELQPFPTVPAALRTPTQISNQNKGFDEQKFKETGYTVSGKIETVLSDQIKAYVTASYHDGDVDVAGNRQVTTFIATGTGTQALVGGHAPAGRAPYSPVGTGSLSQKITTGVVGLEFKPMPDLEINPALKMETFKYDGTYSANYIGNSVVVATGVNTPYNLVGANSGKYSEKPVVPELTARYTGISKVALFAIWDYRSAPGDENKVYGGVTTGTGPMILAAPVIVAEKVKEKHMNLKVGGNWTPNALLNVRAEFFMKDHENNFNDALATGYYTLDYDTYGGRFTATIKPSAELSATTRYVIQRGHGTVSEDGYLFGHSNDSRRYELAETVNWNPNKSFYAQANVNFVWDTVGTVYPRAGGSANDVLHNSDNNFWNGSVLGGFVVDKETDALVQATYYKASNYSPALASYTMPYGYAGKDYSITAGVKHKFNDRMVGSAKVGYYHSTCDTTGGLTNFKGPVGYLSLDYKL